MQRRVEALARTWVQSLIKAFYIAKKDAKVYSHVKAL